MSPLQTCHSDETPCPAPPPPPFLISHSRRQPAYSVLFRAAPGLRDSVTAQETLPTWVQLARFAAAFEPPKPGSSALLVGSTKKGRGGGWSTPVGRGKGRGKGRARRFRAPGGAEPLVIDMVRDGARMLSC